jgi:hypothetical protein
VGNGKPQIRFAQETLTNSIMLIQRNPLAFTKWLLLERTGSR